VYAPSGCLTRTRTTSARNPASASSVETVRPLDQSIISRTSDSPGRTRPAGLDEGKVRGHQKGSLRSIGGPLGTPGDRREGGTYVARFRAAKGLIALYAVAITMTPVNPVTAQSWTHLTEADFPANVQAIVFPNGNTLDAGHPTTLGQWTVRFGSSQPTAAWMNCPSTCTAQDRPIVVRGLTCNNTFSDEMPCQLVLSNPASAGGKQCFVTNNLSPAGNGARFRLDIPCPANVRFGGAGAAPSPTGPGSGSGSGAQPPTFQRGAGHR
jgi:hypothetical protein